MRKLSSWILFGAVLAGGLGCSSQNSPTSPSPATPTTQATVTSTPTMTSTPTDTATACLSCTSTFTGTPTSTSSPTPTATVTPFCGSPITFGDTVIYSTVPANGYIYAILNNFSGTGQIGSMEVYMANAGSQLQTAVYAYAASVPDALLAQSPVVTSVVGWNTVNFTTPLPVSPGYYWLAVQTDGNLETGASTQTWAYVSPRSIGTFPPRGASWSAFSGSLGESFSLYANVCP